MNKVNRFDIESLQRLCDESEEESLTLEFKMCNELKVGTSFWDKKRGTERDRQREDVLDELTKDVTALLNSAGGMIVYGIQEDRRSRASRIDEANSFRSDSKQNNIQPEKVIDWLRDNIQPPPTVDVYRVFQKNGPESPWYIVIDIPQGQQAYMARDHRFYKRVGATVKPMEQYEVADVMNRTRGAALDLRMKLCRFNPPDEVWSQIRLDIEVTSTNFTASEYGALKLTIAYPLRFDTTTSMVFGESYLEAATGLSLGGEYTPHAQSIMVRWGAHKGNIVFPGDWYNFYGNGFSIDLPTFSLIPNPTYLFQVELFTTNSQSEKRQYIIQRQQSSDDFEILRINLSNRDSLIASFWETYHTARDKLKK